MYFSPNWWLYKVQVMWIAITLFLSQLASILKPFYNIPMGIQNTKPPNTLSFFSHFNKLTPECDFDLQNSSTWVCITICWLQFDFIMFYECDFVFQNLSTSQQFHWGFNLMSSSFLGVIFIIKTHWWCILVLELWNLMCVIWKSKDNFGE